MSYINWLLHWAGVLENRWVNTLIENNARFKKIYCTHWWFAFVYTVLLLENGSENFRIRGRRIDFAFRNKAKRHLCASFHRDWDNDWTPSTHHHGPSVFFCQLNSTFVPRLSGSAFFSFQSCSRSFPDSLSSLCQPYGWIEAHLCKHQVDPVSAVAFWTQLLIFIFLGTFTCGSSAWRRGFPSPSSMQRVCFISSSLLLIRLLATLMEYPSCMWSIVVNHRMKMFEDSWCSSFFFFFGSRKNLLSDHYFSFVLHFDGPCSSRVRSPRPNKILKWDFRIQHWDEELGGLRRFLPSMIHLISLGILELKLHAELLRAPWGAHMLKPFIMNDVNKLCLSLLLLPALTDGWY